MGRDSALIAWVRLRLGDHAQGLSIVPDESPDYELSGWLLESTQEGGPSRRSKLLVHLWRAEQPVCFHFVVEDPAWPKRGDMMLSSGTGSSPGLRLGPRPDHLGPGPQDILLGGVRAPYRVAEYVADESGRSALRIVIEATLPDGAGTIRRVFEAGEEGGCRFLSLTLPGGTGSGRVPEWFDALTSSEALAGIPWQE